MAALSRSLVRHPGVRFLLHGDEAVLKPLLAKRAKLAARAAVRHSAEQVRMDEKPGQALRRGRNTSMWRAIESVAKKEAQVAVSAGNTGALMAMSMFQLGLLDGIDRPAIAALWADNARTERGARRRRQHRHRLAAACRLCGDGRGLRARILGLERPIVGLLNVGAEDVKGNDAVRGAAQILRGADLPIEFCGFVEGDDISEGTADVVVTGRLTGNTALKTAEGTATLVMHYLRTALRRNVLSRLGALLASGALKTLRRKLDPRAANGGIFLG